MITTAFINIQLGSYDTTELLEGEVTLFCVCFPG